MITETDLLAVVDAFSAAKGWKDATISSHVFNDGKKISQLRNGRSITVARANGALRFLSKHWPDGAAWPQHVPRPTMRAANE